MKFDHETEGRGTCPEHCIRVILIMRVTNASPRPRLVLIRWRCHDMAERSFSHTMHMCHVLIL
jgi:hypothetical protein